MSKKTPPRHDIERALRLIVSEDADDPSADVAWARQILAGDERPPPGAALRPEVAYALVERLIETQQAEMLARLAQGQHQTVSKAARTGLHRLRTHKLDVAVPVEAEHGGGTGRATQHPPGSLATVYDSRWERLLWLVQDAPNGVRVYQARIAATHGLMDLQSGTTSRKEYRGKTRQVLAELGGEMVDAAEALWLLHEAVRRCEAAGRTLPRGYVLASQALGPAPEGQHPALAVAPADRPDLEGLYHLWELRYWHPDREFLQRLSMRIDEAGTSRLVLSDAQQKDRLTDIVDRAVAEYFTEQRCSACRALLLDTAHLFAVRGDPDVASRLRAAADIFTRPCEEVVLDPFARRLVERVVDGQALEQQRTLDADAGQDATKEDDTGHGPRTKGGLIVP